MKAHKITLLVLDFDELGADEVSRVIEEQRYPNHCINPDVLKIETADVGEWDDDHPLNHAETRSAEIERVFNSGKTNEEFISVALHSAFEALAKVIAANMQESDSTGFVLETVKAERWLQARWAEYCEAAND